MASLLVVVRSQQINPLILANCCVQTVDMTAPYSDHLLWVNHLDKG